SRHAAHVCRFSTPEPGRTCVLVDGTFPAWWGFHGTLESAGEDATGSWGKLGRPSTCQGPDRGGMPRAGSGERRRGHGPAPLGAACERPELPSTVSSGGPTRTVPSLRW